MSKASTVSESRRNSNGIRYLLLSVLVIILDQLTKFLTLEYIEYNTAGINILPFFNLVHVYNYGAAFSIFADWGGSQRYFLSGIAIVMTLVFVVILVKTPAKAKWHCISFGLFVGGAIGNLIDRLMYGYVVDFLLFYYRDETGRVVWSYPAFNVADIAVCVGAALLVVLTLFGKDPKMLK